MNNKISIDSKDKLILKNILSKYPYDFYIFGSRTGKNSSRYSDIDIFCFDTLDENHYVDLLSELEDSNLTIKCDLLERYRCSDEFFEQIKKDLTLFSNPK